MMRLALDASYGRAKFTDTGEEGPGNWVPPSPPIVHLGLLVPSSRESVSCRQSIRACSQVGEARGGGGAVGGGWCVCCRGAPKDTQPASRQTAIMHAGKQAIKEGRGESSSAAQAWPIKIQHSFPPSAGAHGSRSPGRGQGRQARNKQEEPKKKDNQPISSSLSLCFCFFFVFFCCFFFVVWPKHGISTEVWENGPHTHHSMLGEGAYYCHARMRKESAGTEIEVKWPKAVWPLALGYPKRSAHPENV